MITIKEAEQYIQQAKIMNPGDWVNHSYFTAEIAKKIGSKMIDIDADLAYCYGLLHDIGRRAGVYHMRHIIDGYDFMIDKNHEDVARICLTHSFVIKNPESAYEEWDCSEKEFEFVSSFIESIEYNDYDKLIQLSNFLAMSHGPCILEKRLLALSMEFGINNYTKKQWIQIFELKKSIEKEIEQSIYDLFPNIGENSKK